MNQNSNAITSGAIYATPDVRRQTEVEQEFVRVEEYAGYISKIVDDLESKLSASILAQRTLGNAEQQSNPEPVRVPLAQRLYELGGRLERCREQLSSILDRIEA